MNGLKWAFYANAFQVQCKCIPYAFQKRRKEKKKEEIKIKENTL